MSSAPGVVVITRDRRRSLLHVPGRPAEESEPTRSSSWTTGRATAPRAPCAARSRAGRRARGEQRRVGAQRGVEALDGEVVAFADDGSWWAAGALARVAAAFQNSRLGLLAARIRVGDDGRLDPTCRRMRTSPLGRSRAVGRPRVLGFVACRAAVRRRAFLEVGGFHPLLQIGGEEQLPALDLAAAGWELCYFDDVIAHHHPDATLARNGRPARQLRNELWVAILRRPGPRGCSGAVALADFATRDKAARRALAQAIGGLAHVVRARRPVPSAVERDLRLLEVAWHAR